MDKTICRFCGLKSSAEKKLTDSELDVLENNCAQAQFEAGDIILKQDALSTNVAYVKSGLAKIHIKGPNKEKIMKIVKAPTYLCLPSAFGEKINHFSVTALEKTAVCFIDMTTFKSFIYNNGDFAYQLIIDMSKGELQNFHNLINMGNRVYMEFPFFDCGNCVFI